MYMHVVPFLQSMPSRRTVILTPLVYGLVYATQIDILRELKGKCHNDDSHTCHSGELAPNVTAISSFCL